MATTPIASIPPDVLSDRPLTLSWFDVSSTQATSKPKTPKTAALPLAVGQPSENASAVREQVLLEHLPLVRFVARRIHDRLPQHVELEDLVSAGIVGLIDAYNKFDHGKNVQFRSYAQFRIRGAILDSLRNLDWGSRELRRKGRALEEATQKLTQQVGRRPSETEIAAELGMKLEHYQDLLCDLRSLEVGSLHETRGEDSNDEELTYLPAAPEEGPLFQCMKREMTAHLTTAIETLPEREARVLALYYVEEMTLKEIGAVLGLVESRVSQIRAAAIVSLRARLDSKKKISKDSRRPAGSVSGNSLRRRVPTARFAGA